MFKLYSKIKYIFPSTAGDNWQEPERTQSLSFVTMGIYFEEAPMENSVHNTFGNR